MTSILSYVYSSSYGLSLLALIFWFYFKGNKEYSRLAGKVFLLSFLTYLVSLGIGPSGISSKLIILSRDLIILAVVARFFSLFKNNAVIFLGMLIALAGTFKLGYFDYLVKSYKQQKIWPKALAAGGLDETAELLVDFKPQTTTADLEKLLSDYNVKVSPAFTSIASPNITELDEYYVVDVPTKYVGQIDKIQAIIASSDLADHVEDNEVLSLNPLDGDPEKSPKKSYGINDPDIENLWAFDKMGQDQLYDLIRSQKIKPKKKATIAILDTGVDSKHEDIKENYTSFASKFDDDPHSHGTHCAGIAAAVSNNKKGIASFTPENGFTQVASVKVLNRYGMGSQRSIINGILKAADNGADVISMSLGGPSDDSKQKAYIKAVKYANAKGAIVICAAGNENVNAMERSPANVDGVITVSAIDKDLNKASFSNTVQDCKRGIAAPGVNIYSTIPNNKYAFYNGTSMACPYVAGLVGLLKSVNPDLTTDEVYKILNETGVKTGSTKLTGNFIQSAAALNEIIETKILK